MWPWIFNVPQAIPAMPNLKGRLQEVTSTNGSECCHGGRIGSGVPQAQPQAFLLCRSENRLQQISTSTTFPFWLNCKEELVHWSVWQKQLLGEGTPYILSFSEGAQLLQHILSYLDYNFWGQAPLFNYNFPLLPHPLIYLLWAMVDSCNKGSFIIDATYIFWPPHLHYCILLFPLSYLLVLKNH